MSTSGPHEQAEERADAKDHECEDHECEEPRQPSKVRTPSRVEIEAHEAAGHATYRNWCAHCVAGKGRATAHRQQGEGGIAEVGVDLFYPGAVGEGVPHVVARDRPPPQGTGAYAATALPAK